MIIYAIFLKGWDMDEPYPQEYLTSKKKAQVKLAELAAIMDSNIYDLYVSPLQIEAKRRIDNQSIRTFTIQSIYVQ